MARALACLLVALAAALPARADYEAGLAAARAKDYVTALREWRPLAEQGHRAAQFNVGLFYAVGRGVAPDPVPAVAWITVAQENGHQRTALFETLKQHMSAAQLREAENLAEIVRRHCRVD
ncbi:MAG TPA: hypothetical protein VLA30_00285 [Burkholderiales bacterium]|nr:hypothetical protein [Burkholderiales bacterium]